MPAPAQPTNELTLEYAEDFSEAVKIAFGVELTYDDLDTLSLGELFDKVTESLPKTFADHRKSATMMAFYTLRRAIAEQTRIRTPRRLMPSMRLASIHRLKPKSVQKTLKTQHFRAQPFVWSYKGYEWAWRIATVLFWLFCLPLVITLFITKPDWNSVTAPLGGFVLIYATLFMPAGWLANLISSGEFACSRLGPLAKQHLALNYKDFLNRGARFDRREAWEAFTNLAQYYAWDYQAPIGRQTRLVY